MYHQRSCCNLDEAWDKGPAGIALLEVRAIREVVKTIILEQRPPSPNYMVASTYTPLPQPQKMVSLLHSHPSIQ